MKLATFAWSWTVEVPDDFDESGEEALKAQHEAFLNIQEKDGEITEIQDK